MTPERLAEIIRWRFCQGEFEHSLGADDDCMELDIIDELIEFAGDVLYKATPS